MTRALFIVDVQNDFTEGGALGVEGGADVASGVNALLGRRRDAYELVVASRDWHDAGSDNGGHFATDDEPDFAATWPRHCVADTDGAAYHPNLDTSGVDVHIRKGQGARGYSLFDGVDEAGTAIADLLAAKGVTHVDVTGIATDYCVRASALSAIEHGLRVRVFTDLVAGVAPESTDAALAELGHAGAELALSSVLDS